MPELPDLENYAKNIFAKIQNDKILSVYVYAPKAIIGDIDTFKRSLTNRCVSCVKRSGKELFFTVDDSFCFSVHLMLSGKFEYVDFYDVASIQHKILSISFINGRSLVVCDIQSLAKVKLNAVLSIVPDALSPDFTYLYFLSSVINSKRCIKAILIDQTVVRGIGNAYADEILWASNIDGASVACKIPINLIESLFNNIHCVLSSATEKIAELCPDIIGGEERSFLSVHNQSRQLDPLGNRIFTRIVASKQTYYTKTQILYE